MMRKAALMVAGDSTRMMPLSANVPKHILPVAGKPFIFHNLLALQEAGIKEVLLIYGYHGAQLKEVVDSQDWGSMNISYITQKERLGTAHAAGHAKEFAGDDDILLMNGDVIVGPKSFEGIIKTHKKDGHRLTLSGFEVDDPSPFALVKVNGNKVTELIEKPLADIEGNLANAGIYCVGPDLWDAIDKTKKSKRGEYEITDSIEMLIEKGLVGVFVIPSWWEEIGKPWDLLEVNKQLLSTMKMRIDGTVEDGANIRGEVIIDAGAYVRAGAYIIGPAYIGPDCVVGPNCFIRAHTYLESNVKIGNGVEIKNSIILDGTNVGHLSYVGDSVIGRRSNFGAGTITANLRHDDRAVHVTVKGKRVSSGRRKLGAIIGDDVKTGIGTLISPGAVLHSGARTGIGTIVNRDIEPGKMMKPD
jgi:bifunctional UDP-N-acetylglucosamine pyrophosphorylase/glucosamine-1-phosphate N-acetyltransferase